MLRIIGFLAAAAIAALPAARAQSADPELLEDLQINSNVPFISDVAFPSFASLTAYDRTFISAVVYPGATHAWDRLEPAETVTDPFSHLGQGGQVEFVPNPPIAAVSRAATVRFVEHVFGSQPSSRNGQVGD